MCKYSHDIDLHKVHSGEKGDLVEETDQHFKTSRVEILKQMEGTVYSNQKAIQDFGNENTIIFIVRTASSKISLMQRAKSWLSTTEEHTRSSGGLSSLGPCRNIQPEIDLTPTPAKDHKTCAASVSWLEAQRSHPSPPLGPPSLILRVKEAIGPQLPGWMHLSFQGQSLLWGQQYVLPGTFPLLSSCFAQPSYQPAADGLFYPQVWGAK